MGATDAWGPPMWKTIHFVALGYENKFPTPSDVIAYETFFHTLADVIPCHVCAGHYREELEDLPLKPYLESGPTLFEWTVHLHNRVNERLGKPKWSVRKAYNHYTHLINSPTYKDGDSSTSEEKEEDDQDVDAGGSSSNSTGAEKRKNKGSRSGGAATPQETISSGKEKQTRQDALSALASDRAADMSDKGTMNLFNGQKNDETNTGARNAILWSILAVSIATLLSIGVSTIILRRYQKQH